MAPYIVIFAILALLSLSDVLNVRREQRLVFLSVIWLILIIFAGFRYESPDWIPYKIGFEEVSRYGLNYMKLNVAAFFEPIYNTVVYLISLFTEQHVVMFTIIAMIAVTLNLSFYRKYSSYFLIAILLYFVHTFLLRETIQIRAGVAASIALWALPYAMKRQFWKFLFIAILAMGFHMASVAIFLVYIVVGFNWSRKTWAILLVCSFVVGMLFPFGKLLSMLPGGGIFDRVLIYSWMTEGDTSTGILTNPTILKQLCFSIIGLYYWDTLKVKMPYFMMIFIPMLVSVCWLMVWNDFAIIAGRMGTLFSITEVLAVPMLFYITKPNSRFLIYLVIIAYALAILLLNYMVENIFPYQFILNQ